MITEGDEPQNQYLSLPSELPAAEEGGARSWSYSYSCPSFQEQKPLLQRAPSTGGVVALLLSCSATAACKWTGDEVGRHWQVEMRSGVASRRDGVTRDWRAASRVETLRGGVATRGGASARCSSLQPPGKGIGRGGGCRTR
jgi:hypothetical protein